MRRQDEGVGRNVQFQAAATLLLVQLSRRRTLVSIGPPAPDLPERCTYIHCATELRTHIGLGHYRNSESITDRILATSGAGGGPALAWSAPAVATTGPVARDGWRF